MDTARKNRRGCGAPPQAIANRGLCICQAYNQIRALGAAGNGPSGRLLRNNAWRMRATAPFRALPRYTHCRCLVLDRRELSRPFGGGGVARSPDGMRKVTPRSCGNPRRVELNRPCRLSARSWLRGIRPCRLFIPNVPPGDVIPSIPKQNNVKWYDAPDKSGTAQAWPPTALGRGTAPPRSPNSQGASPR